MGEFQGVEMLTQGRVKELFEYNNGNLIRKKRISQTKIGDMVGSPDNNGYLMVSIDNKQYRVHRVVWLWHKGYFPEHIIDHKDRVKTHNRIENLREMSQTCNLKNTEQSKKNTSGVKGVSLFKRDNKWRASICCNGVLKKFRTF